MAPPDSGGSSCPNMKEISEITDLETPEKTFLIKKRGTRVTQDVQDICKRSCEDLAMVLSSTCALGDPEPKGTINNIVEEWCLKEE